MLQQLWAGWLINIIRRPGFWLLTALILLITIPHYGNRIEHPAFLVDFLDDFGLDRHAFERIAYLAPIIWAGFLFGWRGAFATSLIALACMLPRAIFISDYTMDALFETSAVFILGNVVTISFDALRKERDRRGELERAQSTLELQLQVIKDNERRLAALNKTSAILSESLELQQVLDKAIDNVMDVMQVEAVLIYLVDEEAGELSLAAHRGISTEFAQVVSRIRLGESSSGKVAETGEPLYVEDASQDSSLADREVAVAGSQGVHSLLSVPLKSKGKVMATLSVLMHTYRWFREDEVELLTAIGNQIGVAIENARLYEQEREFAEQLRASEERYRELFENAHDAIWLHDLEGNIIAANRACVKLTGYSLEELNGLKAAGLLSEDSSSAAREVEEGLLKGEAAGSVSEVGLIRKDGTEAFIQLASSLIFSNGQPAAFQHIARDVTEEKRMRENLSFYLREVTKAQEEERKRIARELHDETIQALVVLSRQLDGLASSTKGLSEDKRRLSESLRQQTNNIMEGVRRLSQDLRPPSLDRLGLLPALEWLASNVTKYSGITVEVKRHGAERRLPADAELVLFRIAQEAISNVWKHSQATSAEVIVEFDEGKTKLTVSDNGIGFDLPSSVGDLARDGKLGLAGMQERARLLGSSAKVESEPGKGTTVTVEAPT
ncbi:MAG: PAS domain S-box protein [Dehalococcoidia bacterium]|nr:PAS domain S-box protein [Dehalococcoidia bacterium]